MNKKKTFSSESPNPTSLTIGEISLSGNYTIDFLTQWARSMLEDPIFKNYMTKLKFSGLKSSGEYIG